MGRAYYSKWIAVVAGAGLWLSAAVAHAAPEIFWVGFNDGARTLHIHGSELTGPGGPGGTSVQIAGSALAIDAPASSAAELVVPFDNILAALPALVQSTPQGSVLPAEGIYVLRVTTGAGADLITAYFPRDITEESAGPGPITTEVEPCPCAADYNSFYTSRYALLWPTCSTPESSNRPYTAVPTEQYIEATMIDEVFWRTVTIGSDSSASPRTARVSSCYVLNADNGQYLAGPRAVSDAQHNGCVEEIYARESICRGCDWLENC